MIRELIVAGSGKKIVFNSILLQYFFSRNGQESVMLKCESEFYCFVFVLKSNGY